jgi:hypothetical protein
MFVQYDDYPIPPHGDILGPSWRISQRYNIAIFANNPK